MRYVIGIDGGATKTQLAAMDPQMQPLYRCRGDGVNLASTSPGEVEQALHELLSGFFEGSGLSPEDCAMLCLGAAGAGRDSAKRELRRMLSSVLPEEKLLIADDSETALLAGTETGVGILLVSGTGSICRARGPSGQTCRVGGWGHIIGDEGSGYDMGRQILTAAVRHMDGRDAPTLLTDLVLDAWGLSDLDGLIDAVYRSGKGKREIAALAALCDPACEQNDAAALGIAERCAAGLAELAVTAARIFPEDAGPIPCVYAGSLLEKSPRLRELLRKRLSEEQPRIVLAAPLHDAAWGCARMAWLQAGG